MRMRFYTLALLLLAVAQAQDRRHVTEPKIPSACVVLPARLTAVGTTLAEADEKQPDTARIQKALDQCASGKAVELKADGSHDAFLSGPLQLRKGVTLLIDRGAVLFGSRNPRDYDLPSKPGVCGTITEEGSPLENFCQALINGDGVDGAAVMGDGIIDGRGDEKMTGQEISWWALAEQARVGVTRNAHPGYPGGNQNCPHILTLVRCNNFTLYRTHLRNSTNFFLSFERGDGLTVWGVIINAPASARNTDGIAPISATNITIQNCFINTGDDHISVKAPGQGPTTHMTIAHNHFYEGHGMSIGSNTDGGASAIRVTDLSLDGADNGLRIKSNITLGGLVHDVEFDDVCIRNTKNPIVMDTQYTANFNARKDKPPQFTDIRVRNTRISGAGKISLAGLDHPHRLGIQFDNVTLDQPGEVKVVASHADIKLGPGPVSFTAAGEDVTITGTPGPGTPNACTGKFVPFPAKISVKQR